MQNRIKTALALILALLVLVLAGCANSKETVTLYDTETLRIEREGRELLVHDLAGAHDYTLTTQRVKKTPENSQEVQTARSLVDTETITIETARKLVIVTDKTAQETLYIQR